MTPEQRELDRKLWWTTVRPWLAHMTSWPSQPHPQKKQTLESYLAWLENTPLDQLPPGEDITNEL